jgi:hypothetical protein
MSTYSADQIIDKTLVAKKPVKLYRLPNDSAENIYTVMPGQTIGKVFSYLVPGPERSVLYWAFYDDKQRPYYTPHITGNFDIKSLSDQGALTIIEQQEQAAEQQLSTTDKAFRLIKNIAFLAAGAYLIKSFIDKR